MNDVFKGISTIHVPALDRLTLTMQMTTKKALTDPPIQQMF